MSTVELVAAGAWVAAMPRARRTLIQRKKAFLAHDGGKRGERGGVALDGAQLALQLHACLRRSGSGREGGPSERRRVKTTRGRWRYDADGAARYDPCRAPSPHQWAPWRAPLRVGKHKGVWRYWDTNGLWVRQSHAANGVAATRKQCGVHPGLPHAPVHEAMPENANSCHTLSVASAIGWTRDEETPTVKRSQQARPRWAPPANKRGNQIAGMIQRPPTPLRRFIGGMGRRGAW